MQNAHCSGFLAIFKGEPITVMTKEEPGKGLTLTKVYGIAGLSQSKVQGAIADLVTCL